MANFVYNYGKFLMANGNLNLITQNIEIMLVSTAYKVSNTAANLADANVAHEIASFEITTGTVSNYARQPLASREVAETDDGGTSNGFAFFKAANTTFPELGTGNTVGGAIMFRSGADNNDSPLIAFYDLTNTPTNGGDITVQWASDVNGGVLRLD